MPVNFTGSYTQDFNNLANTGTSNAWANDSTILGWSLFKQPTPGTAITTYGADNGGSATGNFFSYGTTAADRALGGLGATATYFGSPATNAVAGWIAFAATNITGATQNTVNVAFNGEQWRNGGNNTAQSMVLQYGFGATFAAVSTWNTPGGTFNWASPVATTTAAAVDGNVAGRVVNRGGTLTGLNWLNSSTLWVRWVETNDPGNDHGLAIDDFSLSLPTVNLSVSSNTGSEAGTTIITVTATASNAVSSAQTVSLVVSGTGITTGDYTLSNSTITIPNGATTGTATFTVKDDVLIEGTETAMLTLSSPSAGIVLGSTTTQAIAITDNDFPAVNLSVSSNAGSEAGTTVITVTATAASAVVGDQTLNLDVSGTGITTGDYSLSNSTITILGGQTTGTATFTVKDDVLIEGSETATLTLSSPSAGITLGSTISQPITITDNDFPIVNIAAGINPAEGSTQGTYTLTLNTPAPTGGLTINYSLTGSTATTPADYTLAAGSNITGVTGSSFTIAAGQTSATLLVNAVNDGIVDPNETVKLNLAAGSGYTTGYNATTPFTAATPVAVGTAPYSVAIGDFNGDGKADFAAANSYSGANSVSIRLGDGLGGFTATPDVAVGSGPFSVAIGDFNGDGKADFAAANSYSGNVSIRLGDGLGGFTATPNVAVGSGPFSVAIGDFNGDGKADFATANLSNNVSIRLGDGLGGFTGTTNVPVGSSAYSVAIGDFNGDGKADFATANSYSGNVSIRLGDGLGGFTGTTTVAVGTNPQSVAIGDFNGDGKADFATANYGSGNVSIRLGDGLGGFTGTTTVAVGTNPQSVAIADFNGDGKLDFATANDSGNVSIRLGDGLGGFTGTTTVAVGTNPQSVAIADFNGDGKADIATANLSSGNVSVLLSNAPSATLTIADAPTVNLSVSSNAGSEAGTTLITVTATASSVVSSAQTVNLDVSGTGITAGDYTLSNSTITIPNGATTGSVSFTVANDAIAEGTETAILTLSNPSAGITLGTTTTRFINITDNDTAGVSIIQSGGTTTITEGGATDTYTVALTSQPTADVTITLNPGSQTSTNTNSLTFTAANWNVAQTVTVTATDDNIAEGIHSGTISHTATSTDPNYNNITIVPVTATITDNDTAGVSIIQSGGTTTITEGGATDTYTVALTSQPTADVTITLNPGSQTSTNTNTLTFTAANWNVAQTITVTAVNDLIAEGTHSGTITHTASSTDLNYNGIVIGSVTAAITDNDTAGVSIIQSGGTTTITEGGATDTYTVALTSQPTANVTITLNPDSQTSTSASTLTFTSANWNVAQTITVTAVNDLIAEGLHPGTITHTATSTDLNYNNITIGSVTAAITDNDNAGVSIIQSGGTTTITEGGATDTYTVALTSQPTANVTVALNPGSQTTTNTNSLTFTSANWNVAQTVTVTAIDDNITEGAHTGTISHSASSSDPNYNGIVIGSVTAAITDNDNPPTDLTLSTTSVNENVAPNTTIGTFSTLDLDGGSFTYSLVPGIGSTDNSAFSISGNQLRIINSPDFETQASYSVRVRTTDFSGLSYEEVVSIIVNNLNDAPILTDTVVALNSIRFNAPAPVGTVGTSISQLVDFTGGSGQNNVIDPDAGALTGIAITNVDSSNGTWFYSTNNGTNWSALGGVSDTNALLLADNANTRLYFRPTLGYTGTVTNAITYRAWDQTSGTNGATANTTSNGNPTAFSVQFDTASLQVNRSETTDFTQDGKPDILWRNSLDGSNCVWEMDGTTYKNTTNLIPIDPSSGWNAVAIGDFTQDGKPDILWRNSLDGSNCVWEMDGTTYKNTTNLIPVDPSSGWEIVGTGDFTQDGKTDILWRNSLDGSNCVWEMDGTTYKATTNLIPIDPQSGWEIVGTGDFTQDGKTDILWRNSLDGSNCVWEMDGTTYKATTNLLSVSASSGWKIAGVGDFTNDGNPDILWRNSVNGSVGIWGMNGTTYNSFTNVATISPSTGWNIV